MTFWPPVYATVFAQALMPAQLPPPPPVEVVAVDVVEVVAVVVGGGVVVPVLVGTEVPPQALTDSNEYVACTNGNFANTWVPIAVEIDFRRTRGVPFCLVLIRPRQRFLVHVEWAGRSHLPDVTLIGYLLTSRVAITRHIRGSRACWVCEAGTPGSDESVLDCPVKTTVGVRLARIPEHHATKAREALPHLGCICAEGRSVDVARSCSGIGSRCSEIYLYVLVWADILRPIIPVVQDKYSKHVSVVGYKHQIPKSQFYGKCRSALALRKTCGRDELTFVG